MSAPDKQISSARRLRGRWWIVFATACVTVVAAFWLTRNLSPENAYRRGRAALLTGDRETVLREAESLIQTPKYQSHGWLLKGLLLSRLGKLDQAITYLEKSAENESLAIEANTVAAQCLYQSGLYLQAIQASNRALERDERCVDARRWLAAAYYDLGAVTNAVEELERISVEAPADPRPTRLLGLIARDSESYPDAIQYYRESLTRDTNQPEVVAELAECLMKRNQPAEALVILGQCEPSAVVLTLTAECLSRVGRLKEAHDSLRNALRLEPQFFPAMLALGKLHLDQGNNSDALQVLTDAVRRNPNDSQAHFQLSQAMHRAGDKQGADRELQQMQEIQALEREFSSLHAAAAKEPNDAALRFRAGEVARQLGKLKLARLWYRAALAIDPSDIKSRSALHELDRST